MAASILRVRSFYAICVQSKNAFVKCGYLGSQSSPIVSSSVILKKVFYNTTLPETEKLHQVSENQATKLLNYSINFQKIKQGFVSKDFLSDKIQDLINKGNLTSENACILLKTIVNDVFYYMPWNKQLLIQKIFENAENKTVELFNAYLNAMIPIKYSVSVDDILIEMEKAQLSPNEVTFSKLIGLSCVQHDFEMANNLAEYMKSLNIIISSEAFSFLAEGKVIDEDHQGAIEIFNHLLDRGMTTSWSDVARISCAFIECGFLDSGIELLEKFKRVIGVKIDNQSFSKVLSSISKQNFESAAKFFKEYSNFLSPFDKSQTVNEIDPKQSKILKLIFESNNLNNLQSSTFFCQKYIHHILQTTDDIVTVNKEVAYLQTVFVTVDVHRIALDMIIQLKSKIKDEFVSKISDKPILLQPLQDLMAYCIKGQISPKNLAENLNALSATNPNTFFSVLVELFETSNLHLTDANNLMLAIINEMKNLGYSCTFENFFQSYSQTSDKLHDYLDMFWYCYSCDPATQIDMYIKSHNWEQFIHTFQESPTKLQAGALRQVQATQSEDIFTMVVGLLKKHNIDIPCTFVDELFWHYVKMGKEKEIKELSKIQDLDFTFKSIPTSCMQHWTPEIQNVIFDKLLITHEKNTAVWVLYLSLLKAGHTETADALLKDNPIKLGDNELSILETCIKSLSKETYLFLVNLFHQVKKTFPKQQEMVFTFVVTILNQENPAICVRLLENPIIEHDLSSHVRFSLIKNCVELSVLPPRCLFTDQKSYDFFNLAFGEKKQLDVPELIVGLNNLKKINSSPFIFLYRIAFSHILLNLYDDNRKAFLKKIKQLDPTFDVNKQSKIIIKKIDNFLHKGDIDTAVNFMGSMFEPVNLSNQHFWETNLKKVAKKAYQLKRGDVFAILKSLPDGEHKEPVNAYHLLWSLSTNEFHKVDFKCCLRSVIKIIIENNDQTALDKLAGYAMTNRDLLLNLSANLLANGRSGKLTKKMINQISSIEGYSTVAEMAYSNHKTLKSLQKANAAVRSTFPPLVFQTGHINDIFFKACGNLHSNSEVVEYSKKEILKNSLYNLDLAEKLHHLTML